jgi:hypothetical protein
MPPFVRVRRRVAAQLRQVLRELPEAIRGDRNTRCKQAGKVVVAFPSPAAETRRSWWRRLAG